MGSPLERTIPPIAAFFDLDKTIMSRSSTLVFGPSFYRCGLISRGDVVRSAMAQVVFRLGGASHQRMEKIRDQVSQVCRGWPADRVAEIIARNLHELIVPHVYAEARELANALSMRPVVASCHLGLARYHRRLGHTALADDRRVMAARLFAEMGLEGLERQLAASR